MKKPTWNQFIVRVGGAGLACITTIMLTAIYYPSYQGIAVLIVSGFGILLAVFLELKSKYRKSKKNHHK